MLALHQISPPYKTLTVLRDNANILTGGAQFAIKLNDLEISLGYEKKSDDELLDYALRLPGILTKKDNKLMVVMFDEFQDAPNVTDPEIFKRMRAHFQTLLMANSISDSGIKIGY